MTATPPELGELMRPQERRLSQMANSKWDKTLDALKPTNPRQPSQ